MHHNGTVAVRDGSPMVMSGELEHYRGEARALELQVSRKEAELRRAKEEQTLLKELRTMNEMIIKKKERKVSAGQLSLKISPESLAELRGLEDKLRLENKKTAELQSAYEVTLGQLENVERALGERRMQLAVVKRSTHYDEDTRKATGGSVALNEFLAKRMALTTLYEEQKTIKDHTDRLTGDIEELAAVLDEQALTEGKISEAEELLGQQEMEYQNICEQVKSYERLRKKKERMLDAGAKDEDKYKRIRMLESDKRVLHNNLSNLRESNVSNTKSVLSLEVRLRQIETRLEGANLFLKQVFAEVEDDEIMDGVPADAEDVPLTQFEELCHELQVSRETVLQRDKQLDDHDAKAEKLEHKIAVLQNAIASRTVSSQLQVRGREKEYDTLASHANVMQREFEEQRRSLIEENEELRKQIAQM